MRGILMMVLMGFLSGAVLRAQAPREMVQYDLAEGLTHQRVLDIRQDQFGYVWVATAHGLNRLDGHRIERFRHQPDNPNSLAANYVSKIYETVDGSLWFSYAVGGLSRYDRISDSFAHYPLHIRESDAAERIRAVVSQPDSTIWIGASRGFYRWDVSLDSLVPATRPEEMEPFGVGQIVPDGEHGLWLLTYDGIMRYDTRSNQCDFLELEGEVVMGPNAWMERNQAGKLWITSKRTGVWQQEESGWVPMYRGENGEARISSSIEYAPDRYWFCDWSVGVFDVSPGAVPRKLNVPHAQFHDLIRDSAGRIFGRQRNLQAVEIDTVAGVAIDLKWLGDDIMAEGAMLDARGEVWWGTNNHGVLKMRAPDQSFHRVPDFDEYDYQSIRYLTALDSGQVRAVLPQGMTDWDEESGNVTQTQLSNVDLLAWVPDGEGGGWQVYTSGAIHLDAEGLEIERITIPKYAYDWEQVADHEFWWFTANGIYRSINGGSPILLGQDNEQVRDGYYLHAAHAGYKDRNGRYWVGAVRYGLVALEMEVNGYDTTYRCTAYHQTTTSDPLNGSMTVNVIREADDGTFWLGTYSSGLVHFDPETGKMERMPSPSEYPVPNVLAIMEDSLGRLWMSATDGVYRFTPETRKWAHFDIAAGGGVLRFHRGVSAYSTSGCMYFGGEDGVLGFRPDGVEKAASDIMPVLSSFQVNGSPWRGEVSTEAVKAFYLDHDQNNLQFRLVPMHYDSEPLQYRFRMLPLDSTWEIAHEGAIRYQNLPPGSYRLQVRAGLRGESLSGEAKEWTVTLAAPYWTEWWFVLAMIAAGFLLLLTLEGRRRQVRRRKAEMLDGLRRQAVADFHDELGHKLTRISLQAEVAQHKLEGEEPGAREALGRIGRHSQDIYQSTRDLLWAMDPRSDALMELAVMLKDFGDELFDNSGISFRAEPFASEMEHVRLPMDRKRHLTLLFKEAMHNSLKHAQAANVTLQVEKTATGFQFTLQDDGKGFDTTDHKHGLGLRNMQDRASQMGGTLTIKSVPGVGTRVHYLHQKK